MKYIKLYESFETDLEDILLDITDLGYRYTIDNGYTANDYNTISIENTKDSDFNIILDCALRLKDFLDDRYVSCYYYQIGYGWKKFNLEEGCNIKFWNFIMYLKIFYRSDLQSLYSWGGKKVNEMHHRFNDKPKTLRTQDIKDCFLELEDSGFIIKVYFNKSFSSHVTGSVTITKERINGFLPMFMLDDLKEVLLFAIPYLQENYYLDDVKYAIYSKHGSCGRYRNLETLNKINPSIYNFTWDFSVADNINVVYSMKKSGNVNEGKFYKKKLDKEDIFNRMDSLVNYNLISDLRDMSLEYLDDGFTLNLDVRGIKYHRFYDMDFGHDINKKARDIYHAYLTNVAVVNPNGYNMDKDLREINNSLSPNTKLRYCIHLYRNPDKKIIMGDVEALSVTNELISRLSEAYPNEHIKSNLPYGNQYR